jgi:hypothetical protein
MEAIGCCAVRDHLQVVVQDPGVAHAERGEDALLGEFTKGLAAHLLDDLGEEEVAGVAVVVLGPRREVQGLLARDGGQGVVVHRVVLEVHASHDHQVDVVPHAACVVEEVADRDRRAVVRQLRQELVDVVVQGELPVVHQQENARSRELLRGRADVEHRPLGIDGHPVLHVRQPVALLVDDAAVLDDAHGAAGRARLGILGEDGVDVFGEILGISGRGRSTGES